MKSTLTFSAVLFAFILGGLTMVSAQTPPPGAPSAGGDKRLGFLTQEERAQLKKAQEKAFASDPSLKAEQEDFMKQRASMKDASPDDRKAFREKMKAHEQKMHDALLKADPTVGPILDKMAAHHKEMMGKHKDKAGSGTTGGQSAPGTPQQ